MKAGGKNCMSSILSARILEGERQVKYIKGKK